MVNFAVKFCSCYELVSPLFSLKNGVVCTYLGEVVTIYINPLLAYYHPSNFVINAVI